MSKSYRILRGRHNLKHPRKGACVVTPSSGVVELVGTQKLVELLASGDAVEVSLPPSPGPTPPPEAQEPEPVEASDDADEVLVVLTVEPDATDEEQAEHTDTQDADLVVEEDRDD